MNIKTLNQDNKRLLPYIKTHLDYVLVDPIKLEKDFGGLEVPVSYEEKVAWGEIVGMGEQCKSKDLTMGLFSFYNKYSTIDLELPTGEKYHLLKEEDIIASIEKDKFLEFINKNPDKGK